MARAARRSMLYFNKILPVFVLPVGWCVLLLLFALVRKKRWPVLAALAVLYVSSLPAVGEGLLRWLESHYTPVPVAEVEPADAVVVLGGIFEGPRAPGAFVPNLGDEGDRLEAGIELMQKQKAGRLVFTGARFPWEKDVEFEGALSKRAAIARGVPAENILITHEVANTWDEARAVAGEMRQRGWKRVILVTSSWHMFRAARLFRAAGVDFTPFPVDYRVDPQRSWTVIDFLPKAEALEMTSTVLRECYGVAFYAMTGR
jgi:uncharacterized SAM-binding protein YcdF (DUF218 family)